LLRGMKEFATPSFWGGTQAWRGPSSPCSLAVALAPRPMSVVPFPRQLRLTVSFSVLEDACSLIDRSKEILAAHGGDFDDFWLTADGDWSMTFDVSQRHAEAVFRQLRKLSDFHAENSLDTATPDIENSELNFRRGW
jgi:hypothetical protein